MKKNKKLFAILTLVAFMITLMPVMAFAAGETLTIAPATGVNAGENKIVFTITGTSMTTTADAYGIFPVNASDEYVKVNGSTTADAPAITAGTLGATGGTTDAAGFTATVGQKYGLFLTATVTAANTGAAVTPVNGAVATYDAAAQTVVNKAIAAKFVASTTYANVLAPAATPKATDIKALKTAYDALSADVVQYLTNAQKADVVLATSDKALAAANAFEAYVAANSKSVSNLQALNTAYVAFGVADFATLFPANAAATAQAAKTAALVTAWENYKANPTNSALLSKYQVAYTKADAATRTDFGTLTDYTAAGKEDNSVSALVATANFDLAQALIKGSNLANVASNSDGSVVISTKDASRSQSNIVSTDVTATVDTNETIDFDINLKDGDGKATNKLAAGSHLIVWVERNSKTVSDSDTLTIGKKTLAGAVELNTAEVAALNSTRLSGSVTSKVDGKITVKAAIYTTAEYALTTPASTAQGAASDGKYQLNTPFTGTFEARYTGVDHLRVVSVEMKKDKVAATNATLTGDTYSDATANSMDKYVITLRAENKDNVSVADKKITLSANKSGLVFNNTEVTTNGQGEAKIEVTTKKKAMPPTPYVINATCGNASQNIKVAFAPSEVVSLNLVKAPKAPVAVDSEVSIKVSAFDTNSNKVGKAELESKLSTGNTVAKLGNTKYPVTIIGNADGNGDFKFGFTPDKVGTYTVKVTLDNGNSVTADVEVKEQGQVTKMTLNYDADTVNIGAKTSEPEVIQYDAAGVEKTVNNNIITFAATGEGVKEISTLGAVSISDRVEFAGNKITVTAVDGNKNINAVATLTIASNVKNLAFASNVGQVGIDNNIQFSVVDEKGNKVALGKDATIGNITVSVSEKPLGAIATAVVVKENDLKTKGVALLTVNSNQEGLVEVLVMIPVEYTDDNNKVVKTSYTGVAKITMGKEAKQPGSVVTMFMGSKDYMVNGINQAMDQAPVIKDNRTFLPIRSFGEAIGAKIEYNKDTKAITAAKDGKSLTVTVGSNIITTSDGKTITSDVAPYITENDRTVLQLRAVAEYFGYTVDAIAAADGSTAGVVFSVK